ncbi:hypothetical protein [Agromyces albus]|uniref:DUF4393 domain-containing protein n=1 Tax=Agromyces albus TaxID=205332 RepID=A0A4Q2L850_9MICO|nr:hypothetical protein [Agromyces albus]RXZ72763.1 hypothetical protein ESP51_02900 [Agromyces albus]
MSMSMPEQNPAVTVAQSAALGLIGSFPGMGVLTGAVQGAFAAKARARDEDFWAMVNARVGALERDLDRVLAWDDNEFVAAAHRIARAAQETADEAKRRILAAALAHSGSWSELPWDEREFLLDIVVDLNAREVYLLGFLHDPREWLTNRGVDPNLIAGNNLPGSIADLIRTRVAGDALSFDQAEDAIDGLQRRGLADVPLRTQMSGSGPLAKRTTALGDRVLRFVGDAVTPQRGDTGSA